VVDGGELLVVSEMNESMDDMQKDTGSLKVRLTCSCASCSSAERRPEWLPRRWSLGDEGGDSFAAQMTKWRASEDAPAQGESLATELRLRSTLGCRNRVRTSAVLRSSGGQIKRPGGIWGGGKRERTEWKVWALEGKSRGGGCWLEGSGGSGDRAEPGTGSSGWGLGMTLTSGSCL
jgi:hypothetical protein